MLANKLNVQGFYKSLKTWKVTEFKNVIFQAWKVMEFYCWSWKVMEVNSLMSDTFIAADVKTRTQ